MTCPTCRWPHDPEADCAADLYAARASGEVVVPSLASPRWVRPEAPVGAMFPPLHASSEALRREIAIRAEATLREGVERWQRYSRSR